MSEKQRFMQAQDAISGATASAYAKFPNGKRYCLMQMYKFNSKMEISKTDVAILGKTNKGSKPTGWKGTFSATAYYNTSVVREMLLEYKNTGIMPTIDIQVTNEDPSSSIGSQTIVHRNCVFNGGVLATYDASTDVPLSEDVEGTFDDWDMPKKFSLLAGMEA